MAKLIAKALHGSGQVVIADSFLGKGGEGAVHAVISHDVPSLSDANSLVAKIYFDPTAGERLNKIKTMIVNTPTTDSVAWPVAVLFEEDRFVGYLMKKLDSDSYRQWAELSNTKDRRITSPDFDVKYALVASRNLASAIDSIHSAGHIVGDVNESNIFVKSDASVFIVDTDSAQIKSKNNKIFPCLVGKPEYTAPEISHGSLKDNPRTVATDVFAFAVAIYQILTGGAHPTDGIYIGQDDPPTVVERNRQGIFPGLSESTQGFKPAPRIPSECLPKQLVAYLLKALNRNPSIRPSLYDFIQVFDNILQSLQQCKNISTHWYDVRDGSCPWCARGELPDPWGPVKSKNNGQTVLPAVAFKDGASAPVVRRVAPVVNNSQGFSQANNGSVSGSNQPPAGYGSQSSGYGSQPTSNYGHVGTQPNYTQPQAPQQVQPQIEIPKKIKGKMVLEYVDGSYAVRPPLGQLIRHAPKVAIRAIKMETPSLIQAWWNFERPVVKLWAIFVGLIVGLGIAVSWKWTIPLLYPLIDDNLSSASFWLSTLEWVSVIGMATSALASLMLFFGALSDMLRSRKQNKDLNVFVRDNPIKTILRFMPVSLFYGPLFVVLIVFIALLGILSMFSNNSRQR